MKPVRWLPWLVVCALGCSDEVGSPNLPPVAVAGPDRVALVNRTLSLDGRASYDPNGDALGFVWEVIAANPPGDDLVDLSGFREPKALITPRAKGTWLIRLTVDDGKLKSAPDVIQVTVQAGKPCQWDSDCDDDNPCNGEETCVDNECQPGFDPDCDDDNPCTDDDCDPRSGCTHTPNQAACGDQDPCTINDVCNRGTCTGLDKTVLSLADGGCDDGIACTLDRCDPQDGSCSHTPITGACDDRDPCTLNDECDQDGVCTGIDKVSMPSDQGGCATSDPCLEPACDASDGTCIQNPLSGKPCDDGEPCTRLDTCEQGVCLGSPYSCDDGNICNGTETCSPDDDTCLPGHNLPDSSFCHGDDLIICNGNGGAISQTGCLYGCNPVEEPNHCRNETLVSFGENSTMGISNDFQGVTEDVSVNSENPGSNFDTGLDQDGHIITDYSYLWIRFDISAIPDDAEILEVSLHLYTEWPEYAQAVPDQIYEVAAGADTVPANQWDQEEATWEEYQEDEPWTGGEDGGEMDRGPVLATQTVTGAMVWTWTSWDFNPQGIAYVQERLDGDLNLTVYGTLDAHYRQYVASERGNGNRPYLLIRYIW